LNRAPRTPRVLVVGAGAGGLAAAIDLAARGLEVIVCERQGAEGGKMRHVQVDGVGIDAGPTVFTMRWIFESLFDDAGDSLASRLVLEPAAVLARHAWRQGGLLDLHADVERSVEAIGDFAGAAEARGYREFCARSGAVYRTLRPTFIAAQQPSPLELVRRVGWTRLAEMWATAPHLNLWQVLGQHFRDPRLRQLFGRYATYCGSSPLTAPATLMLVAHVEQDGVWLVRGGMRAVAAALAELARRLGATLRTGAEVRRILVQRGRASGVELADGEVLQADAVVFNGDAAALAQGLLGHEARVAAPDTPPSARSLSAVTWCARARASGFDLHHHNVFFAEDYEREFREIFERGTIAPRPTVYLCAQDRGASPPAEPAAAAERMLLLINAPANGDTHDWPADQVEALRERAAVLMRDCGLQLQVAAGQQVATTPREFAALFPGSGGALYGRASVGATTTFKRPAAASRIPGLYLAGGSVHPGPGVPMAAMSGRLAAARLIDDLTRGGHAGAAPS
jgi:1-hydroxycarotenoid 3,4-desaturase